MTPKIIFSDFDGTLTSGESFSPRFFDLLTLLKNKNIPLVIVTGRSKSWAHFFLTHFPGLPMVVSEGGGVLTKRRDYNGHTLIHDHLLVPEEEVTRLEQVCDDLLQTFPQLELSTDSFGRHADRAVELVLLKDPKMKQEIEDFLTQKNVNHSTSSVHLNFWCGQFTKISAIEYILTHHYPQVTLDECLYIGDSLNDQTAFAAFKHSVGVANIRPLLDKMHSPPSIVLQGDDQHGVDGALSYLSKLLK